MAKDYYVAVNVVSACVSMIGGILALSFSLWMLIAYKRIPVKMLVGSFLLFGVFFVCLMNLNREKKAARVRHKDIGNS